MPMAGSRAAGTFERGGGGAEGYETAGGASLMARLALGAPRGVGACRRRGGPLAPRGRLDELGLDELAHGGRPHLEIDVRVGIDRDVPRAPDLGLLVEALEALLRVGHRGDRPARRLPPPVDRARAVGRPAPRG